MQLLADRVGAATRELEAQPPPRILVDGARSREAYRDYVLRTFGFVAPLEDSLRGVFGLSRVVDMRRFHKDELLRRDLVALDIVEHQPRCTEIPTFDSIPQALGWAYVIERSTLTHNGMFHAVATNLPREAAFAASYLKCYSGAIAETWRAFTEALNAVGDEAGDADRIIEATKDAYGVWRRWFEEIPTPPPVASQRIQIVR